MQKLQDLVWWIVYWHELNRRPYLIFIRRRCLLLSTQKHVGNCDSRLTCLIFHMVAAVQTFQFEILIMSRFHANCHLIFKARTRYFTSSCCLFTSARHMHTCRCANNTSMCARVGWVGLGGVTVWKTALLINRSGRVKL